MSNINNITINYDHKAYLNESGETHRIDTKDTAQTEEKQEIARDDKVSLSQTSKEMQMAKDAVASIPDVRHEKIDRLKEAIEAGSYEINAEKIAEKLVGTNINELV